jgi:hypothetical protein
VQITTTAIGYIYKLNSRLLALFLQLLGPFFVGSTHSQTTRLHTNDPQSQEKKRDIHEAAKKNFNTHWSFVVKMD